MPQRSIPLVAGEYYHIYNRGNNRQDIFFERENYLFFLRRVRKYLVGDTQTSEVSETARLSPALSGTKGSPKSSEVWTTIIAYCLMPNHLHLLVCAHDDELSRRMQRFSISYTKAMTSAMIASALSFRDSSRRCSLTAMNISCICHATFT